MNFSLQPLLISWVVLAVIVLALAVRRKVIAGHVDADLQHVLEGGGAKVPEETKALDHIDRWGKTLTVVAVVYGLALAGLWAYQAWMRTPGIGE